MSPRRRRPHLVDELDALALRALLGVYRAAGLPRADLYERALRTLNRGFSDPGGADFLDETLEDELGDLARAEGARLRRLTDDDDDEPDDDF